MNQELRPVLHINRIELAFDIISALLDTSMLDTGKLDTGKLDTGKLDTDKLDTGQLDTGRLDIGKFDTGKLDTGKLDTGKLDTGKLETGKLDTGKDPLARTVRMGPRSFAVFGPNFWNSWAPELKHPNISSFKSLCSS